MTRLEKIHDYMNLCGIQNNSEIKKYGEYPNTIQWLCKVLNGTVNLNEDEEKLLYKCVSIARMNKSKEELDKE